MNLRLLWLCLASAVWAGSLDVTCAEEAPADDTTGRTLQQSMIWLEAAPAGQEVYVVFRKEFELADVPQQATLHLFADSRYTLWINGQYVERGPCRFDPKQPEYDTLDVRPLLRRDSNALAVLVHHYHDGRKPDEPGEFSGRIMRHAPGLTVRLELAETAGRRILATDETWRGSHQTRYLPSGPSWTSIFDRIDARRDDGDWAAAGFDDSRWAGAVRVDGGLWGPLQARGIPRLRETEVRPLSALAKNAPVPLEGVLPLELSVGEELVVDAGRFFQAYSVLDFEADAGTALELEYPPTWHANGGKPGGAYGVNRYIARAGQQSYMSGDTYGGKYLVLRVKEGRIRLSGLKLVERLYPFDLVGRFHSSDERLNAIWQLGADTIRLCSEDAYVDCATRERVEWLADAVMVAYPTTRATMAGPGGNDQPRYGDPRLLRNLLRHIGQSQQLDARVKAHHPSNRWDIHGFIDDYACLWIQAIRTYHDHTGDLELAREQWPAIAAQLQWFLDRRTERGLVRGREFIYFGNPLAYKVCEGATLNACLVGALGDAAELARLLQRPEEEIRYTEAATALATAINQQLWDEAAGAYGGAIQDGQRTAPTMHAGMLCLYYDVVPGDRRQRVERWVREHFEQEGSLPYQHAFFFDVFYHMNDDAADRLVLDLIRRRWGPMIEYETKTTWEGFSPGEPCHEAGAVPTIFLSNYVLGVRVDGPVDRRRLLIEPRLGGLELAEGVVATELGPVPVTWKNREDGLSFAAEIPAEVNATVGLPRHADWNSLVVDGNPVALQADSVATGSSRFARIDLGPGKHTGELRRGNR